MGLCIYMGFILSRKKFALFLFIYYFRLFNLVYSDDKAHLWSTETSDISKEYIDHQKPTTCLSFDDQTFG